MDMGMKKTELGTSIDMTQGKLAKYSEIGARTLSGYEVGSRSPDLETLFRIADYFDVITDYLLGRQK